MDFSRESVSVFFSSWCKASLKSLNETDCPPGYLFSGHKIGCCISV